MELITYIENYSSFPIPPFKHTTKIINQNDNVQNLELFYSPNITIPDKVIMPQRLASLQSQENIKCFILFGYQLKLKDWENIRNLYPQLLINIKLYRGNQVSQVSDSILNAKSFLKGQRKINQPFRSLIKKDQKSLQSCIHIYTVQISCPENPQSTRILYYLPGLFDKKMSQYPLQCVKSRYFNHKILQILNQYVSLDNNSTTCYKDLAHHQFETIVYSGKVSSFEIFIRLQENTISPQVTQSFLEKLSQISMTDKHLLDEVDPLDFSEIKKEIRAMYLEQKRIRKSLTLQKLKIVEEIENTLQFLNLKQVYPQKLTYNAITPEMLKRIRSQNIDNKAIWIKEQNFILRNLDARIIDLQNTKNKYRKNLLQQEKSNYQQIQALRNRIKNLQISIKYEQAEKDHQIELQNLNLNTTAMNASKTKNTNRVDSQNSKASETQKLNLNEKGQNKNETLRKKNELEQLQKQKILKHEMFKAEFEMQKQFARRKIQYAKAAQQIFSYLIDC